MRSITKEHHLIDVSLVSFSFLPFFSSIYRHFASPNLASTAIHVLWSSCSIFRGSCILALFLSLSLNGLPSFDPNNRIPYSWQCFRQSKETKEACVHLHEHPTFQDPVKYEAIYLQGYENVRSLRRGLASYFAFYNHYRFHQNLDYETPDQRYRSFQIKELAA